jgi:hypothetical protein
MALGPNHLKRRDIILAVSLCQLHGPKKPHEHRNGREPTMDEPDEKRKDPADHIQLYDPSSVAITNTNDLWIAGDHKLLCGSALVEADFQALMGDEPADLAFADGPYNVPNEGHVTRREGVREFAMAAARCRPKG